MACSAQTIGQPSAQDSSDKGAEEKNTPDAKASEQARPAKLAGLKSEFLRAWGSDWIKALIIGPVFCFIPLIMAADICVQCLLRCSGAATSRGLHTQRGQQVIDWFCGMNLAGVFVRICVLGEIYFTLNVLFAKLTYIFLSWLNLQLVSVNFVAICFLVVFVGFIMFMLPPVPGIPVYVFTGIVIGLQSQQRDWLGFNESIVLATLMSVFTKLVACTGQYFIGYYMGTSIKIQQLIGVDTVPTRAIEKILSKRGLQPSKVTVLIGGPDWPVSVTCGILRVNIPQMLLGTLPVIFICSPCVVAGACLTRVTGGSSDPWVGRSGLAILVSTICQGGAAMIALVFWSRTIATYREELARPRPEHAAVEELTRREQRYSDAYMEVTAWITMGFTRKVVIVLATFGQLVSNGALTLFSSRCFRPFYLSSRISSPSDGSYYPPGLDGNAWRIVRIEAVPLFIIFGLATLLHIVHCKTAEARAKRMTEAPPLNDGEGGEEPKQGGSAPAVYAV